jgi:hypothetical protein
MRQKMTQISDSIPSEPDPQLATASLGLTGKYVCPFCGTAGDKSEGPCARCLLENTPQTRQSTRWRLGPWYVLQSRNPAAPGMKYTTLLALIRKGQVNARSVIRGPTTQQFWRFAGRTKGISREFGICWSCGGAVQVTASACPGCNKSQELPPNPDLLLENDPALGKTLYVEISPKTGAAAGAEGGRIENSAMDRDSGPLPHAGPPEPVEQEPETPSYPSRRQGSNGSNGMRPPAPMPSSAATMAAAAGIPSPENAPRELQSRPRHVQTREKILSAKELAAAFSLQFNPKSDTLGSARPPRHRRRQAALALVVVLFLSGAVAVLLPSVRDPAMDWLKSVTKTTPTPIMPQPPPDSAAGEQPKWAMKPPMESTPDASAQTAQTSSPNTDSSTNQTPPSPATAPPISSAPASVATGGDSAPAAAPADNSGGDLDAQAMHLRSNGLDAEGRHDYAAAQFFYEQIEKLPREHWPADTDQLLKNAQKMNQSASSDH